MDKMTTRARIWIFILFLLSSFSGYFIHEASADVIMLGVIGLIICVGIFVFALDTNED